MQKIPAAQFKAQCLAVMDQVSQSGQRAGLVTHDRGIAKRGLAPVIC